MIDNEPGLKIVKTWPGPGTGDVYSRTEDGRVWLTSYSTEQVTGREYGQAHQGRMYPLRETGPKSTPTVPATRNRKARRAEAKLTRKYTR